ncbi:MAG: peptide-methionine (S)-S-oxide reductase MsrA [Bryobacterales bacterium]|nr:peptide-methionine (S)-S-oxide reductase MsrA [Bryobacterales bacterium]
MGQTERATLGGGCFWCLEAVYQEINGVVRMESGYMGGALDQPTYKAVCSGTTGHAEVVDVHFDPEIVTYRALLEVFFAIHDPTTLNRQGNDVGTQYRSVVFFHSPEQEQTARAVIAEVAGHFGDPIVTQVAPAEKFWKAEDYHQNYFRDNPYQGYCLFVVSPKVDKFRQKFRELRRS